MISDKIRAALNEQIEHEGYASYLYLSMASWCEHESLDGCADFLYAQSDEERGHMLRIYNYLGEMDAHAITPAIKEPPTEFESVKNLFEKALENEQAVTKSIHEIVELCYEEDDYSTLNFIQWYVEEQREEENTVRTILDKIKLIGDTPQSLYYIDKEVASLLENGAD